MEVLQAMEADAGTSIRELRVDGGATADNLLLQFQANVLNTVVVRPQITETTAMGAAYLAGLAVGFWKDLEEVQKQWKVDRNFGPDKNVSTSELIKGWHRAVRACKAWAEDV
jgi:glycerol kinase